MNRYLLSIIILLMTNAAIYYTTNLMLKVAIDFKKDNVTFMDICNNTLGRKSLIFYKFFLIVF
jgi:hypothetical protein